MAGTAAVPDMRLELVPLPVSDVDRAKAFYEQVGFGNVHDTQVTETMRVVQLTPPGSSCATVFGTGMGPITDMVPGSVKGLHLVVEDMAATRAALTERGIETPRGGTQWRAEQVRRVLSARGDHEPLKEEVERLRAVREEDGWTLAELGRRVAALEEKLALLAGTPAGKRRWFGKK